MSLTYTFRKYVRILHSYSSNSYKGPTTLSPSPPRSSTAEGLESKITLRVHRCLAYNQQYSSVKFSSFASIWPAGELVTCCSRRLQLEGICKWACHMSVPCESQVVILCNWRVNINWQLTFNIGLHLPITKFLTGPTLRLAGFEDTWTTISVYLRFFPPLRSFLTLNLQFSCIKSVVQGSDETFSLDHSCKECKETRKPCHKIHVLCSQKPPKAIVSGNVESVRSLAFI